MHAVAPLRELSPPFRVTTWGRKHGRKQSRRDRAAGSVPSIMRGRAADSSLVTAQQIPKHRAGHSAGAAGRGVVRDSREIRTQGVS